MKVPVVDAYWNARRGVEDTTTLPYHKQVCIQFLRWGMTAEEKDKEEFITLGLAWRKEDRRVGGKRTLLERKLRKLLRTWRRRRAFAPSRKASSENMKKFQREKRGVYSPEYRKERMREQNRANMMKQLAAGRHPSALEWIVTEPDGTVVRIWNLQKYAIERNLIRKSLSMTSRYPGRKHRGYSCVRANDAWENL
jgi:hypothetical protein